MNVPQAFRHHHRQFPTNQLLCLVAKDLLNSRVGEQNVALVVDGEYRQRSRFRQASAACSVLPA